MNDTRMEIVMGRLLRTGVMLSAAVVIAGGALYIFQQHNQLADFRHFHGAPFAVRNLAAFLPELAHGNGAAVIELGLVMLILTPIARVAFALVAFLLERDKLYTAVSLFILVVLLYGLLFGR